MLSGLVALWLFEAVGMRPSVDTRACPEFDADEVAAALEVELPAEPDVGAAEGSVVVECSGEAVTVRVDAPSGSRQRTIAGADRAGLTARSLALAIAPLFSRTPPADPQPGPALVPTPADPLAAAEQVVADDAKGDEAKVSGAKVSDAKVSDAKADDAKGDDAPTPASRDATARLDDASPPAPTPRDEGWAAILRPIAVVHTAPGIAGQLGVLLWPSRRIGLSIVATARWGRAQRDRGHVDALVVGGGPGLAVRLGSGRVKFRADLVASLAYATLAGSSDRATTRGSQIHGIALDAMLGVGPQIDLRGLVLVPAIVVGTTPGAPLGVVTDERNVSLVVPYAGLALSCEPWLRRRN